MVSRGKKCPMFLRIKRKKTNTPPNTCYYQIILCRSVRECGVPKQSSLKYLGSIGDNYITIPDLQREFYQKVEKNLSDYVAAYLIPVLMA